MSNNRLNPDLGRCTLTLTKSARVVAWLALAKKGKVKMDALQKMARLKDALLHDCTIDQETGGVTWKDGPVPIASFDDLDTFKRAVDAFLAESGEGVDFQMVDGAVELTSQVDDLHATLKKERATAQATAGAVG